MVRSVGDSRVHLYDRGAAGVVALCNPLCSKLATIPFICPNVEYLWLLVDGDSCCVHGLSF